MIDKTNRYSVDARDGVAIPKAIQVPVGVGCDQWLAVLVDLVRYVTQGHGYAALQPGHRHEHHGSDGHR